jgi:hypothetical protein
VENIGDRHPERHFDRDAANTTWFPALLASANTLYFFFDDGWTATPGSDTRPVTKVMAASALVLWVGVMYWGSMLPFIGNSF